MELENLAVTERPKKKTLASRLKDIITYVLGIRLRINNVSTGIVYPDDDGIVELHLDDVYLQKQANWQAADQTDPAYIQNRPIPSASHVLLSKEIDGITSVSRTQVSSLVNVGSLITDSDGTVGLVDSTSLSFVQVRTITTSVKGQEQVQSDWAEGDSSLKSYIQNKPSLYHMRSGVYLERIVGTIKQYSLSDIALAAGITVGSSLVDSTGTVAIVTSLALASVSAETLTNTGVTPVRSDWSVTDVTSLSYIENKPVPLKSNTTLTTVVGSRTAVQRAHLSGVPQFLSGVYDSVGTFGFIVEMSAIQVEVLTVTHNVNEVTPYVYYSEGVLANAALPIASFVPVNTVDVRADSLVFDQFGTIGYITSIVNSQVSVRLITRNENEGVATSAAMSTDILAVTNIYASSCSEDTRFGIYKKGSLVYDESGTIGIVIVPASYTGDVTSRYAQVRTISKVAVGSSAAAYGYIASEVLSKTIAGNTDVDRAKIVPINGAAIGVNMFLNDSVGTTAVIIEDLGTGVRTRTVSIVGNTDQDAFSCGYFTDEDILITGTPGTDIVLDALDKINIAVGTKKSGMVLSDVRGSNAVLVSIEGNLLNCKVMSQGQMNSDWSTEYPDVTAILNKPEIPAAQVQSNWTATDTSSPAYILNKPTVPPGQVQSDLTEEDDTLASYIIGRDAYAQRIIDSITTDIDAVKDMTAYMDNGVLRIKKLMTDGTAYVMKVTNGDGWLPITLTEDGDDRKIDVSMYKV